MRRRGGGGKRGGRGRGKRGGNCPAECVAEMSVGKEIYRRVAAAASDMLIIAARPPPARDLGCRRSRFLICDAETDRPTPVAARPRRLHAYRRPPPFVPRERVGRSAIFHRNAHMASSSLVRLHKSREWMDANKKEKSDNAKQGISRKILSARPASPKVISA